MTPTGTIDKQLNFMVHTLVLSRR